MLKRIFSYMKQYKKYAYLALICIGIEVVLELMKRVWRLSISSYS